MYQQCKSFSRLPINTKSQCRVGADKCSACYCQFLSIKIFNYQLQDAAVERRASHHHHHHHVVPPAQISLTFSRHSSVSFIASGYIPYPHRAAICRFELVVLLLFGHMTGTIGEHHLWARPCFSSNVLHVWFIFDSFRNGGRTVGAL